MSGESEMGMMIDETSEQISGKCIVVEKKSNKTTGIVAGVAVAAALALGFSTGKKDVDMNPLIAKYLERDAEEVFNLEVVEPELMLLISQLKLEACYTDNLMVTQKDKKNLNAHLANVFAMISFLSSPNRNNMEEFEEIKRLLIESRENAWIPFTTQFECNSTRI